MQNDTSAIVKNVANRIVEENWLKRIDILHYYFLNFPRISLHRTRNVIIKREFFQLIRWTTLLPHLRLYFPSFFPFVRYTAAVISLMLFCVMHRLSSSSTCILADVSLFSLLQDASPPWMLYHHLQFFWYISFLFLLWIKCTLQIQPCAVTWLSLLLRKRWKRTRLKMPQHQCTAIQNILWRRYSLRADISTALLRKALELRKTLRSLRFESECGCRSHIEWLTILLACGMFLSIHDRFHIAILHFALLFCSECNMRTSRPNFRRTTVDSRIVNNTYSYNLSEYVQNVNDYVQVSKVDFCFSFPFLISPEFLIICERIQNGQWQWQQQRTKKPWMSSSSSSSFQIRMEGKRGRAQPLTFVSNYMENLYAFE